MHRQKVRFFCYKESIDDDWEYIKQKSIFQCTPKKEKTLYIIQAKRIYHEKESSGKQSIHNLEMMY